MAEEQELKSDEKNYLPLGVLGQSEVLSRDIYAKNYAEYTPKADPIAEIRSYNTPVEIKVIFGDWCKDSKKHVPALIKSMEFAENKNIQVTFINLDPDKKEPADLIEGFDIESVPTFIVFRGGKEVGRVIETPKVSVEQDLADILAGRVVSSQSRSVD